MRMERLAVPTCKQILVGFAKQSQTANAAIVSANDGLTWAEPNCSTERDNSCAEWISDHIIATNRLGWQVVEDRHSSPHGTTGGCFRRGIDRRPELSGSPL